jgi:HECT-domain (ubiquitin-transferase)
VRRKIRGRLTKTMIARDTVPSKQLIDRLFHSYCICFRKIINLFKVLGQFVSKAMLDSRNIDIPFNPVLLAKILDPAYATDITSMMVKTRSTKIAQSCFMTCAPLANVHCSVSLLHHHRKLMLHSPIRYYSCSPL